MRLVSIPLAPMVVFALRNMSVTGELTVQDALKTFALNVMKTPNVITKEDALVLLEWPEPG